MHSRSFVLTAASIILVAAVARADSPVNFAYRDAKGNIHDFHFDGKSWQKLQLNNGGMTAAPAAVGDPAAFAVGEAPTFSFSFSGWDLPADLRDFSYVGEHGDIHRIFHHGGKWGQEALNNAGATSAPPAAGGPWIRQASGSGGEVLQVFYLDGEGNLQHLSGPQGKWSSEVVNTGAHVTMAPPAGGLVFY